MVIWCVCISIVKIFIFLGVDNDQFRAIIIEKNVFKVKCSDILLCLGASYLVPTLTVHLFKSDANLLDAKKQQNAG